MGQRAYGVKRDESDYDDAEDNNNNNNNNLRFGELRTNRQRALVTLTEQDGRLNYSDQAEMTRQAYQFYTTVTLCLCGTERGAA